ncbi:MAG: AAA family ATPase [Leptodesmis sp.]|uniref:AAA family ATPase n=1 Tax=Leptodesmis sp. TaxID=3100501 RepID=UPI003D10E436
MQQQGKLVCFCGKMAAGKSTLARKIARQEDAVLVEQDDWLSNQHSGGQLWEVWLRNSSLMGCLSRRR